ncbi:MAG: competence/damage-inducible protein A [Rhodothermaceae bacterium]|nr:competence/damage-inducible protein A [Rhodothermaceae bacterium]MYF39302.1 competence/damage-inducible protein A [Rhodothermaceae bacterium]MYH08181.1 competence/damage-inducible protein A [Rhodothermaceae bacterium]MYI84286.1 competence/damage-inducible protein A [Rhodothermaceae bacterium]
MTKLIASIVTVGEELLIGQVLDTNAAYLAAELTRLGIPVVRSLTVGDDKDAIRGALAEGMEHGRLTVLTGGLGPTPDDVSREAAAALIGSNLSVDADVLAAIKRRFALLGRDVPAGSERVASVPDGFEVLPNSRGTAPGLWYEGDTGSIVVLMPGVPHEMRAIFCEHVIPRIRELSGRTAIEQRTLLTAGIGETTVQRQIEAESHLLDPDVVVAYLPRLHGVRIRLTVTGEEASARLDAAERYVRVKLGAAVYGCDDDTLEGVVGHLLKWRGLTVAVAESCTGGLILDKLTNISGSSSYVMGGVVAYSNVVKQHQLGVDGDTLEQFGAVSEPVAMQMAEGVRARLGSDLGLSVTGIAGPSGGTEEKPVGTVWIGYADDHGTWAVKHQFGRGRRRNKEKSAIAAIDFMRQILLQS